MCHAGSEMLTQDLAYARFLDVSGALMMLVILAMLLERALAVLFEYHWFRKASESVEGLKTPLALFASWVVCRHVGFDILASLFPPPGGAYLPTPIGIIVTSAVVAGGSAGAMTLFQGVLGLGRETRLGMLELKKARNEAQLAEAWARRDRAASETQGSGPGRPGQG